MAAMLESVQGTVRIAWALQTVAVLVEEVAEEPAGGSAGHT